LRKTIAKNVKEDRKSFFAYMYARSKIKNKVSSEPFIM